MGAQRPRDKISLEPTTLTEQITRGVITLGELTRHHLTGQHSTDERLRAETREHG
jgi:hypothetical protein